MVGMHRMVPQDISLTKAGGGHVPGGVAPGVVGGAQAAGGEGGGVRLAHDQLLAGELEQGLAVLRGGEEGVVLLGGDAGEGLEPVGVVGGPFSTAQSFMAFEFLSFLLLFLPSKKKTSYQDVFVFIRSQTDRRTGLLSG